MRSSALSAFPTNVTRRGNDPVSARPTSAIEGNPLTLREVELLADGRELPHASHRSVQEVLNTFAALRYIQKHAALKKMEERHVFGIHGIIGQNQALDRGPVGAYRTYAVQVGPHLPPPARNVPTLMRELLRWLNGAGREWPPVVSSGVLHAQFEFIHPFGDGNGRTGRTLALWELYRRGFDTHHIFAVDEYFWENREAYYKALQSVHSGSGDLTAWLEFASGAVHDSLQRAWKRIQLVGVASSNATLFLTPRQERLLNLLRDGPKGMGGIQSSLQVTRQGVHFLLKPLLAAKLVKRSGGHKTGRYSLA